MWETWGVRAKHVHSYVRKDHFTFMLCVKERITIERLWEDELQYLVIMGVLDCVDKTQTPTRTYPSWTQEKLRKTMYIEITTTMCESGIIFESNRTKREIDTHEINHALNTKVHKPLISVQFKCEW